MSKKVFIGGMVVSLGLVLSGCATLMGPSPNTKRMENEIQVLRQSVDKLSRQNVRLQKERNELYNELHSISKMFQQALTEEKKERERLGMQIHQLGETIKNMRKKESVKPLPKQLHPKKRVIKGQEKVKKLQEALKRAGFDPGPLDGKMGPLTINALKEFQKENGLPVTGKVDSATKELLKEYMGENLK